MVRNIVRSPGIYDPKKKAADKAEKRIRKIFGDTSAAKILGKIVKVTIENTPT